MDWKDTLVQASFRGVDFLVDSHEWAGGKNASITEFPQRETVYVEDISGKAETFLVNAILLGDDYPERRDRLFTALASRAAGWPANPGSKLVHPYLGEIDVLPLAWRVTETRREGRLCRVSIDFVKTGEPPAPLKSKSAVSVADAAADELELAAVAAAELEIDVQGPNSLADNLAKGLVDLGKFINSLDVFSGPAKEVADLALEVSRLINTASSLATSPADAILSVKSAITTMFAAAANLEAALFAYEVLFGYSTSSDGGASPTSQAITANASRLQALVRNLAVAGTTRAAVRITYDFLLQAEETREGILDQVDELLEETDSRIVDALETVRVVLANQVPRSPGVLPNLREITLPESLPALVLSYRLYGTPDRDGEIAVRNEAPYPGFLPAQVPLEVLSS